MKKEETRLPCIGIIANPASGKDIRRLVSYATVIDNNEKINIVKRIVLAAQAIGIKKVLFMPDTFRIGSNVAETLSSEGVLTAEIETLNMKLTASYKDSTVAAKEMEALGAGCVVVLGGDGTSRAAAKGITNTPLLPLSTGTNNVYPQMLEGTVAGTAAAAVVLMDDVQDCLIRDKRIEVYINNEPTDIALVDAVLSDDLYAGAKAIWNYDNLRLMAVTRCHPATIGFSAIAGCMRMVFPEEDMGFLMHFGDGLAKVKAPVAAGVFCNISVKETQLLPLGKMIHIKLDRPGMVALDGERELKVKKGDTLSFCLTRNGPLRVLPVKAVEKAMLRGMFNDLPDNF